MLRQRASRLLAAAALASTFVGCSVYQAVVTDVGPSRGSESIPNERLVAIGRTFEIQGKLDKAEQLYRLAVRRDPHDQEAMRRADYLAALRAGPMPSDEQSTPGILSDGQSYVASSEAALSNPAAPGAATRASAATTTLTEVTPPIRTVSSEAIDSETDSIRTADSTAVGPEAVGPEAVGPEAVGPEAVGLETVSLENVSSEDMARQIGDVETAPPVPVPEIPYDTSATVSLVDTTNSGDLIPAHDPDSIPSSTFDVDAWLNSPGEYQDELLAALGAGDTDTRSLAAYLLSGVAPQSDAISSALYTASKDDAAEVVRMASCESLLIRSAADSNIITTVFNAAASTDESTRVQAILSMRHLAGTDHSDSAVTVLTNALTDSSADVRTMAAATLGDLGSAAVSSVTALQELADTDSENSVRQACEVSIARIVSRHDGGPAGETSADEGMTSDGLTDE